MRRVGTAVVLAVGLVVPGLALVPAAASRAAVRVPASATAATTPVQTAKPCATTKHRPWCNRKLSAAKRASILEQHMTTMEKIEFLNGISPGVHTGASMAIPRLGIPQVNYTDGPVGPRQGKATAMPIPMAVAATFDPHEATLSGREIATEAKDKGNDVVFGPTVNIMRTPEGGRTYEAYGEDPFLVATTAVGWIDGAQSTGVMADVKHFAANNQEGQYGVAPISGADGSRTLVNVHVSQRTLHEVYFPQFEAAVKQGHVATVMCSYNQINGRYACENPYTLKKTLEKQWGFKGYVISDYGAAHNVVGNLNNGLDFEPSFLVPVPQLSSYYAPQIEAALASGLVKMSTINDHVKRILRTWFAFGVFDRKPYVDNDKLINRKADARTAERVEQRAIVLLKNAKHQLPLKTSTSSIAVIGPYANRFVTGGGSGNVVPNSEVTALAGIKQAVKAHHGTVRYADGSNVAAAVSAARKSKVAVVVVGDVESEGVDKSCISLNCASDTNATVAPTGTYPCAAPDCPPNGKDETGLIEKVAAANKHTIVVLETGGPVRTWWRGKVNALLEAWYPGERGGTAIANVLFGKADPAGRLPVTFPKDAAQLPTAGSAAKYPGIGIEEYYREGIDIGYRWYEAHHETPSYPFGFGESYTRFRYSHLTISRVSSGSGTTATVSVRVRNVGHRIGAAVPELYLKLPGSRHVPEPPRELKGYRSVTIKPGHTVTVTFHLDPRSFAYYSTANQAWRVRPGCFGVEVGTSSSDLPLRASFTHGSARCGADAVRISFAKGAVNQAAVVPVAATVRR